MDIDKRIEIKSVDKRHYYDIALLVDKPNFIDWVIDLRKKWKIDKVFSSENYDGFYSHIMKISGKISGDNWRSFQKDIEKVRTSFGRLPNFDKVIMYAIVAGEIPDGVYNSCYLETIVDPDDPENDGKYKYAIIVTPNTTSKDISNVLSEFKKKAKAGLQQKKDAEVMEKAIANYEFELGPNYTPPPRVINNIIRNREWYWKKKSDLSYQKIWATTPKNINTADRDGVIKAIKAYEKRLVEI